MKQKFKLILGLVAGAGLAMSVASTASAATFSILDASLNPVGPNTTLPVGTGGTTGFDLSSIYGTSSPNVGDPITSFSSSPLNGGLFMNGSSSLRFTFLGSEAGARNAAFTVGGNSITNTGGLGASMMSTQIGAGFVNFFFQTVEAAWEDINGNSVTGETFSIANNGLSSFSGLSLAYGAVFNGGRSVLAFFGDGRGDIDYDDMVVRIDAVPLPATVLLMFGAFGGLGALRLRKKKAAAA